MPIRRLLASIAFAVAFAPSLAPAQLGGPDVYGYRAVDVDYDFVPLSTGVGTLIVPPSSGDPEIALPWNFNWYGVDYPSVFVGSKGTLGFTDWYLGTNSYCPAAPNTQPDLMPLTQDPAAQLGDPGNEVWAWIDFAGDRVILSWEDVWAYIWSDPDYGPFDFQVHLYASGDIEFHYSSVFVNWAPGDYGGLASVGFQDTSGGTWSAGNVVTLGCSEPVLDDGTAIAITTCADADGDGFLDPACGFDDCDEGDAAINPGAPEACNGGIDDDCDPASDENVDSDGDGQTACSGDCDEGDPDTWTGAAEACDGIDRDCNGVVDDAPDGDGDGVGPCDGDCDDADPAVVPGAPEACNGVDDDCDGLTYDDAWIGHEPTSGLGEGTFNKVYGLSFSPAVDVTIDGFDMYYSKGYTGWSPVTYVIWVGDDVGGPWEVLDTTVVSVSYTASVEWHHAPLPATLEAGKHYVLGMYSGTTWVSVQYDEGVLPVAFPEGTFVQSWQFNSSSSSWMELWYSTETDRMWGFQLDFASEEDGDGDGVIVCAGDCDDADPDTYIDAPELCDGFDQDCDYAIPEDEADLDGDGFLACADDCDDEDPDFYPGAPELCDLLDTDCDGALPTGETTDGDGDGWMLCQDCDDSTATTAPEAPELCDGIDNDCDGLLDPGQDSASVWSGGTPTYTETFVGGVYAPTQDFTLRQVQAWGEVPIGTELTWLVYESATMVGNYVQVASWTSTSGYTDDDYWHTSSTRGIPLTAGGYYAIGVWTAETVGWGRHSSPAFPTPDPVLPIVAGASFTAATPVASSPFLPQLSTSWAVRAIMAGEEDVDGDGVLGCTDCDDEDATVFPGAVELCNGTDEDCDFSLPADETDGDGDGYVGCLGDCDDTDPTVYPGATEACDGVDGDCDGVGGADESLDADGDGVTPCAGDCDDTDPLVSSSATELCNGTDDDCDGLLADGAVLARSGDQQMWGLPEGYLAIIEVDQDTTLELAEQVIAAEGPRPGMWVVYEAASAAGAFDLIYDVTVTVPDTPAPAFVASPPLAIPLEAGMAYAIGLVMDYGPYWPFFYSQSSSWTPSVAWGNFVNSGIERGWNDTPTPTLYAWMIDSTRPALRLTASTESDGDADGFMMCDDCDDFDPAINPGATELPYDGIDNDCDPLTTDDDLDGDGADGTVDCDDTNASIYPGAPEGCDGIDTDCDGSPAADEVDDDADGFAECAGDCDDADWTISPGQPELCNGVDDDCSGSPATDEVDYDADGSLACDDCDDYDPDRTPGAPELCDGVDNDCDGLAIGETDGDGDGVLACADCDDSDPDSVPGGDEICDGIDNDCDPSTDEDGDGDGDGFSLCDGDCDDATDDVHPGHVEECDGLDNDCDPSTDEDGDEDGDGSSPCGGDCDDGDADIHPGASEGCDGIDTDCDGVVPDDEQDADGDGQPVCAGDCDDTDPDTWDGAPELCDGVDNNCNGSTLDEGVDSDGDGYVPCAGDCDDTNAQTFPGADEVCDGQDNSCDGDLPLEEADTDGDGHLACDDDCDDLDADISPDAPEDTEALCTDGLDNDCDGDEDVSDDECAPFYEGTAGGGGGRARGCSCDADGAPGSRPGLALLLLLGLRRRRARAVRPEL